jgi:hypothetical protein
MPISPATILPVQLKFIEAFMEGYLTPVCAYRGVVIGYNTIMSTIPHIRCPNSGFNMADAFDLTLSMPFNVSKAAIYCATN